MDIKQLHYFIIIVESEFNISAAAKIIHISQPALSQMITNFEKEQDLTLFKRSKGRLQELTNAGDLLYTYAKEITEKYDNLMEELQGESKQLQGHIKLGIPPVVISIVFPDLLPRLIRENPGIKFELVELGAEELKHSFIVQDLPIAVLLGPTGLDPETTEEIVLSRDELTAFMSNDHPLAQNKKIKWEDLDQQIMAIFNSTYMIHHLLKKKFEDEKIEPLLSLQSSSWDLQLNTTKNSNLITVLPAPVANHYRIPEVKQLYFNDPISWEIVLCRRKKKHYSFIEEFVFQSIIDYFHKE